MTGKIRIKDINLDQYDYDLPESRIAQKARSRRDESKLLIYRSSQIEQSRFNRIVDVLPPDSCLYLNNTKVIPARLYFQKSTGAFIEVFLTEPIEPSRDHAVAMACTDQVIWRTMIGNLKKWKNDEVLCIHLNNDIVLEARLLNREQMLVQLNWNNNSSFSEILDLAGNVPLPPYVKRPAQDRDKSRYQTVYSKHEGAVAAPTAGLHFSEQLLDQLESRNIKQRFVTLHVSAGTFKPISHGNVLEHPMHKEFLLISKQTIESLLIEKDRIAVGTTSMRTLESLYWYGVMLSRNGLEQEFKIPKLYPYQFENDHLPSLNASISTVLDKMSNNDLEEISGMTEIFIVPGYQFKVCTGLITNFHMPKSTLILLVAAFIGEDWRKVYQSAMENDFQFLSYGDTSLLFPKSQGNP